MKFKLRGFLAALLSLTVLLSVCLPLAAATATEQGLRFVITPSLITVMRGGQKSGAYNMTGNAVKLIANASGNLQVAYDNAGKTYKTAAVSASGAVTVESTAASLTLDISLDPAIAVEIAAASNMNELRIDCAGTVNIAGKVALLSIAGETKAALVAGGAVEEARVYNAKATLTAPEGTSVKTAQTVSAAAVSGAGIGTVKTDANLLDSAAAGDGMVAAGTGSSTGNAVKASTLSDPSIVLDISAIQVSESKAKLGDLTGALSESVSAFNVRNQKVAGALTWTAPTTTTVINKKYYFFTFKPTDSGYPTKRGQVQVLLSSKAANAKTTSTKTSGTTSGTTTVGGSSSKEIVRDGAPESKGLSLRTKNITDVELGSRLSSLSTKLAASVTAYDSDNQTVKGSARWETTGTVVVDKSATYKYIFTPSDSNYLPVVGSIKVVIEGDSAASTADVAASLVLEIDSLHVQGSGLTLADAEDLLKENALAYDLSNKAVDGEVNWVADGDTKILNGKKYLAEFVPDNAKYNKVRRSVQIFID